MPNDENFNENSSTPANDETKTSKFQRAIANPYVIAVGTGAIGLAFAVGGKLISKKIDSAPVTVVFPEDYTFPIAQ